MEANLRRAEERFAADPADVRAFEALEEHHFLHGDWPELVRLYERRLAAPDLAAQAEAAARLCFRLGQVLEERCLQTDRAIAYYQEAARRAPRFRAPLTQLRRLYAAREAWDLVLQVAELEASLPMQPFERASFFTQMGAIWAGRMGDAGQGLAHFERALEADPDHLDALRGLARIHAEQGDAASAAAALERVVARARGPEAAPALVELARLHAGPLGKPERAETLYRSALAQDPRCGAALEALYERAAARGDWAAAAELIEPRFELVTGATRRLAIALEAGRIQLEELRNPAGARLWYGRALELSPHEDPAVYLSLAEVERVAGNREASARWLERAASASPESVPVHVLVESALHASERGDPERALVGLRRAIERAPGDVQVLESYAQLLERLGRHAELAAALERQASLLADDPAARAALWLRLGALHRRSGDPELACRALERAVEADPACADAVDALAVTYAETGQFDELRALLDGAREHASGRRAVELAVRLGDLLLERFDDVEAARAAFQAALDEDSADSAALQGLERAALRTGDEQAIVEAFEREAAVTSDRGRLAFLVWELVRLHERREEPEEALLWIERLAQVAPEDRRVLECCARLQEQLGHDDERIETLERLDVVLQGPERAANRRRLAELERKRGNQEAALARLHGALEADPDDVAALRALLEPLEQTGRLAELADVRGRLAERLEGDERVACLAARVALLEALDDPQAALASAERLRREAPGREDVVATLERLLERTARYEDLAALVEERRSGAPVGSPEARAFALRRAEILRERLARPAEAAALYREALAGEDDAEARARALAGLEDALRASGDREGLAELLAERAAAASGAEAAALGLERAALLDEAGRPGEARAAYEALVAAGGEAAREAETRLRALLERAGDFAALAARLDAEAAAASGPQAAELLERAAALRHERLRDAEAARASLRRAIALAPERASAWQALARIEEEAGRTRELALALEGELATQPEPARARHLHARAAELLCELGERSAATAHFQAVLALDPGDVRAAEFLAVQLEREERHAELAQVLEVLLARRPDGEAADDVALRLRLAALRAGPLAEPDGAIAVLEPAAAGASLLFVAEPLADLLQASGRRDALIELCARAEAAAEAAVERAQWALRLADALRARGDLAEAAAAYRRVLAERPEDRGPRAALRDVYRRLGESEPLARLLEAELAGSGGAEEVALRAELAALLEGPLDRPEEALAHWRRVLELEPAAAEATERALALAARLGRPAEHLALLDDALARTRGPALRARRLRERAALLAGPLERPADAAAALREALALEPDDLEARRALRAACLAAGDVEGALAALEAEAAARSADERAALYAEAADLAQARLGAPAALPWLERLRALRPRDRALLRRIREVHRGLGQSEAVLAALGAELALEPPAAERCSLEIERSKLLAAQGATGRALAALEAARSADPGRLDVLGELARLYGAAGRSRERAEALRALLPTARGAERLALRRELAACLREGLRDPAAAAAELWAALVEEPPTALARIELLRECGDSVLAAGRADLWAAFAEAELAALRDDPAVFGERRLALHRALARRYERELARPERALLHWRAVVDADPADTGAAAREAEDALLRALRAARADVELAQRLETRLAREPDDATGWLELAQLYEERLHRVARAADAYGEVLEREPDSLPALRGLRRTSERLGRPADVARALEREIALPVPRTPTETAALWRRLGEVAWRELESTTRASRAFAAALEADPGDLPSLRALESLFEAIEDWRGALDLYESEVELLGEREPARRREVWLRVARIARDGADDVERALRGYERADALGALAPPDRRAAAELYERAGRRERFAESFETWCDDPAAGAGPEDHVRLAAAHEALGDPAAARARLERALARWPGHGPAWDALARLREPVDAASAAEALERAAACTAGEDAAERLTRAARLVADDAERAAVLLARAAAEGPGYAPAHAARAVACAALGRHAQAEEAAARALDLVAAGCALDADARRTSGLAGGRAARELGHLDAAARLLRGALAAAPADPDALALLGEVLCDLGDWPAARDALERRLALPADDALRAHLLALLGAALDGAGASDDALARYESARALDPSLDAAHAGLVDLLERGGRLEAAVRALEAWAEGAPRGDEKAARLLRAAELEHRRDAPAAAEALLRRVVELAPTRGRGWQLLAELVAARGDGAEALALVGRALEVVPDDAPERAALCALRGAELEARGDERGAAEAFRTAAALDPRQAEPALAAARLLRAGGAWRDAAVVLAGFAEAHPGGDPGGLARALLQLGRLRAGPLEDVAGAVDAYRRALALDPELSEAEEALADLLAHVPASFAEALERHRALLARDPTRAASLRALLRIAAGSGAEGALTLGLGLLRALGAATPEEAREAPLRVPVGPGRRAVLADPVHEAVRRMAQETAKEIGAALGAGPPSEAPPEAASPSARFRAAAFAEEARLAAPALVPLDAEELRAVLVLVASLAFEVEAVNGDARLVNDLSRALGRRARKRVRRALEPYGPADVAALDVRSWRAELRALAGAIVLEREPIELRAALVAWLPLGEGEAAPHAEADLRPALQAVPEALALLRRVVAAWSELL